MKKWLSVVLGGVLEMALACDPRIAAEHATFGLPEVRRSLIAAGGGLLRLPRAIPLAKAMEIILLGQRTSAQEALHYGLVNKLVPLLQVCPSPHDQPAVGRFQGEIHIRRELCRLRNSRLGSGFWRISRR